MVFQTLLHVFFFVKSRGEIYSCATFLYFEQYFYTFMYPQNTEKIVKPQDKFLKARLEHHYTNNIPIKNCKLILHAILKMKLHCLTKC